MPKFVIDQLDYGLSQSYGSQVLAGSAFAFIAPQAQPDDTLQAGLQSFYGVPAVATRRILSLLPGGLTLPGFKITPFKQPFDLVPVLLPDKEIYRAGKDRVRLLVVTPAWLYSRPDRARPTAAVLTIENNGVVLRNQPITLNAGGLTLVDLGALPQGHYRVFWPDTNEDAETKPAECEFSSVEYVLAPFQATLQGHELSGNQLTCRLKVERFNEPLNEPVQLELWSGGNRIDGNRVKPELPGLYQTRFKVKTKSQERLEVRVSYQDLVATAVIPNSTRAERQDVVFNPLGIEVKLSLQPGPAPREVRGLYLSTDGPVSNTPVTLSDPAPKSRVAKLRWQSEAQTARLLVLDLAGKVVEDRDLGHIAAGTELEVNVPAPGGFLALGAWLGDKAWEGWSSLVAPSEGTVEINAPASARPGQTVELKIDTKSPASVYLLARDSRLAGATTQDRLAATLKGGFESAAKWATLGYISKKVNELDDWPDLSPRYRTMAFGGAIPVPVPTMAMRPMMSPPPAPGSMMSDTMVFNSMAAMPESARRYKVIDTPMGFDPATTAPAQAEATVRQDFADIAFCAVITTGADGRATTGFKLPEAITAYTLEAFALSPDGREWSHTSQSLEVNQPLWAEFKLPAFVYPGDISPAVLEVNCDSGKFSLKLLCDNQPVPFKLLGAKQVNADSFQGQRAKVTFEAKPGKWRAKLQDLSSGEFDISERSVEALGKFTSLARRFQMLLAGQTLDRTNGVLQLRVLPSLDTPFKVLCDATTDYSHRCCEQTAAKLLAGVAALVAAGKEDQAKYRDVILAGVKRERSMFLPGRGFMMYPPEESGGSREPNDYWGKLAARHLGDLSYLGGSAFQDLGSDMREAVKELQVMGENAMQAYRMPLVPEKIESGRDAFQVVLKKGKKQSEALSYARKSLENQGVAAGKGQVLAREEKAYSAATLLAGGVQADLLAAIKAANDLAKDLDGEGRLYSTVDSAALICLLLGLKSAGIGAEGGDSRLKLDGLEMSLAEAIEKAAAGEVNKVEVVKGTAMVEVTSEIVEDWNSFRDEIRVSVELVRRNRKGSSMRVGDTVDLVVKLREYIPGHLLHVCLPSSLSSLEGGGEVKKFSLDFTGKTELRVPLRATGFTLKQGEHWAVLVRNMFNEEQAGTPGLLLAQVSAD